MNADRENIIVEKSFAFALAVMTFCKEIRNLKEFELASQLWRAGTSIGANVEEAQAGQSRADFVSKLSIARKEARETNYWLRLVKAGNVVEDRKVDPLLAEIQPIIRILTSIIKSSTKAN